MSWSTHTVYDGKWKVTVHVRVGDGYTYRPHEHPELRVLLEEHYQSEPQVLAKAILENVLHCDSVHVETLSGDGFYMIKCQKNAVANQCSDWHTCPAFACTGACDATDQKGS